MKKIIFFGCLFASHTVLANLNMPGIFESTLSQSPLAMTDKTLAKTGLPFNEDALTDDQTMDELKLNPAQLHEAKVWGLTFDEEKRYTFLMQNRSGVYYQGLNLTPVDILGLNARNETERAHFAELAAAQEAQKISKNLAWNNAFHTAYNTLFEGVPVVGDTDLSVYAPAAYKPVTLSAGDTLYLFLKKDDAVKSILLSLIEALKTTADSKLHIMLLDCDDISIQQWANQQQIPKGMVSAGRLTLNHGDMQFNGLKTAHKKTPLLLLARSGASSIVDLGRF